MVPVPFAPGHPVSKPNPEDEFGAGAKEILNGANWSVRLYARARFEINRLPHAHNPAG